METENKETRKPHQGSNVARLRRAMGMKQEALAQELNISQQAISLVEQKRILDKEILLKIANTLHVTPLLIEELEEDPASLVVENNTFELEAGSVNNIGGISGLQNQGEFNIENNPIEEILKQSDEKMALYERLLEMEKKNVSVLQQLLNEKEK